MSKTSLKGPKPRNPLVVPMLKHTKPGLIKSKRQILIERARKEDERVESTTEG